MTGPFTRTDGSLVYINENRVESLSHKPAGTEIIFSSRHCITVKEELMEVLREIQ